MSEEARALLKSLNIDYKKVEKLNDDEYLIYVEEKVSDMLQRNLYNMNILKICEEIMDYLAS